MLCLEKMLSFDELRQTPLKTINQSNLSGIVISTLAGSFCLKLHSFMIYRALDGLKRLQGTRVDLIYECCMTRPYNDHFFQ
jgi:hypothetical protein